MITIDHGIPIPPGRRPGMNKAGYGMYPFAGMEIGDSFVVAHDPTSVRVSASTYGRRHGMKFTTRIDSGRVRVWRVA